MARCCARRGPGRGQRFVLQLYQFAQQRSLADAAGTKKVQNLKRWFFRLQGSSKHLNFTAPSNEPRVSRRCEPVC